MDRRNRVLPEDMRGADRTSVRDSAKKKRVKRRQRFLPLAIGTTGKRPDLKRISGQEKLPVLALTDGTTVNGSDAIVAWARKREASAH